MLESSQSVIELLSENNLTNEIIIGIMEKQKWFQLDKKAKVVYIEDIIDKLAVSTERLEKKELENRLLEIINWQEEYDKH